MEYITACETRGVVNVCINDVTVRGMYHAGTALYQYSRRHLLGHMEIEHSFQKHEVETAYVTFVTLTNKRQFIYFESVNAI